MSKPVYDGFRQRLIDETSPKKLAAIKSEILTAYKCEKLGTVETRQLLRYGNRRIREEEDTIIDIGASGGGKRCHR